MEPEVSAERVCEVVCFVGGAAHSGSTLLGLALGSHPAVVYAGEANKSRFLGDERKPLRKRTCKVCGVACPVWRDLRIDAERDVYEALARRTGRHIVVDSTKATPWLEEQSARLAARGLSLVFVVLGRDGRAVLGSSLRKYPERSAREHAHAWVAQMEATEALAARFPGRVVRARYEELVTRPAATLERLARELGLALDERMLDPFAQEHHPIGGNAGTQSLLRREEPREDPEGAPKKKRAYYDEHPRAFVLDLRWRREVSTQDLADFEAVAGEHNRRYAWDASEGEG